MRTIEFTRTPGGWAASLTGSLWHGLGTTKKQALEDLKRKSRKMRRERPDQMAKEGGHGRSFPPVSYDDLDELDEIIAAYEASEEGRACLSN